MPSIYIKRQENEPYDQKKQAHRNKLRDELNVRISREFKVAITNMREDLT